MPTMSYIQLFIAGNSYPYAIITDGTTDQTSVLQTVLTAAGSGGGTVLLPLGPVVTNLTGLSLPAKVALVGQGNARPYTNGIPNAGSWLISPNSNYGSGSNPVITLGGYNTLKDFAIYGPGNGYGSSTSRPNLSLSDNYSYLDNVTLSNSACAIQGNYKNIQMTDCWIQANGAGGIHFVDSDISKSTFSANGYDLDLGGGSASNRVNDNRFEYSQNNTSILASNNAGDFVNTNAATASGTVLHFASTSSMTAGYQVYNSTHPASIPFGTYIISMTSTTVTLNQSVSSAVSSGDSIMVYLPQGDFTTITANQFDASYLNAIDLQFSRLWTITGNNFRRSGVGATNNTSSDASIHLFANNLCTIANNTFEALVANVNDPPTVPSTGRIGPSFGFWDDGANFGCQIKGNVGSFNPVDGTHGGGINSTTNFPNFNTDNTFAKINTVIANGSLP